MNYTKLVIIDTTVIQEQIKGSIFHPFRGTQKFN